MTVSLINVIVAVGGGKLSSSSDRKFLGSREGIFNVYESLTLVGTLFKDKSTNKYQSKKGKLIIRELTKNKFGKFHFNSCQHINITCGHSMPRRKLISRFRRSINSVGRICL